MRRNLLLHLMGSDTYDIVCDKAAPRAVREMDYRAIIDTLEDHFNPEPLEISENFRFNCRRQGDKDAASPDETVDEYLVALRRISLTCNFGNYLETALRNQLVFGMKRNDIRGRLLEKRRLTLQEARDIAVSMELSLKGGAEIAGAYGKQDVHTVQKSVNVKKTNEKSAASSSHEFYCFRCGEKSHFAKQCKHENTECRFCGKKGHLEKVCMKKSAKNNKQAPVRKGSTVKAHYIEHSDQSDNFSVGEICAVDGRLSDSKFWAVIAVNGVQVRFEIDTGCPVSIINLKCYEDNFKKYKLSDSALNLMSYCNTDIRVHGCFEAVVEFEDKKSVLPLFVVDSSKHPLLGREWLRKLHIDWNNLLCPATVNTVTPATTTSALDQLFKKYSSVFEDSIGRISSVQANLHLKPNAKPVFLKARKLPFNLKSVVDKELDKLVAEGVLTKVDHSDWATPIVPVKKSENRVRICGDYKQTVNPLLLVDQHPLPTVDEMFSTLAGGKKFTKIDLVQAYLQLEVAPADRCILTLNTHRGLYRPTRLMYGVASAPAIWQRQIEVILQGIEGVSVFLDDIKITGPNDIVHLQRLEEVLRRLNDHNVRVNKGKCEFFANEIEYCGYLIDRDGIHKLMNKMEAIRDMPRPRNKDEVRSFIGLVNYYGRFIENLSTVIYPLNNLLKDSVAFEWNRECENAFRRVKQCMQSNNCLVHYSPELPLVLATDASPYGVGAVLSHVYPDGSERPIQFASQTLNSTQQKYMQVDKEAYAIIFGVKKFFQYLYGRKFLLLTDNQAISKIFGEHKGLPVMSALRMQHYATFLQSFDYQVRFRRSANHANADALSRIPLKHCDPENVIAESDIVEVHQIETLPLTATELSQATSDDNAVKILLQGLKYGQQVDGKDRFGIDQTEFSVQRGCLLRGICVYVPLVLRKRVLEELLSTHFGVSRTKSLARGYCWWAGMDKEIEDMVANCTDCQSVRPEPTKLKPHFWEPATEPFQRVHADFAGPFMDSYFFILVDSYTKWPEIRVCRSITAEATETMCREIFATYGIPAIFVSDHGVQFTAESFQRFLKLNGVVHKMGAPYHPATNGQAERYVQTFKQKLKALKCPKSKLNLELANILLTYRKMIHPSTGQSPSMLMFGRQIRSRLDLMLPQNSKEESPDLVLRTFADGDRVRVRDFLSSNKWQFGRIVSKVGKLRYAVRLDDGRLWERHVDHIAGVGSELMPRGTPNSNQSFVPLPTNSSASTVVYPDRGATSADARNTTMEAGPELPSPTVSLNHQSPASPRSVGVQSKMSTPKPVQPQIPKVPTVVSEPLRRSTREKRAPQKLNL
ncbi:uncharacterized protein K02A2.6-like [Uranotaenia lowii]|uniref:uncharacterized protein K02A2.6-like n=1 Tax=Uranotaenia lowii TaxID=190385 RepID=UPI0024787323|nr:uncharacterized protein K02A2.6-like [Uranotaenia lowii]